MTNQVCLYAQNQLATIDPVTNCQMSSHNTYQMESFKWLHSQIKSVEVYQNPLTKVHPSFSGRWDDIFSFSVNYQLEKVVLVFRIENLISTDWAEPQFDIEAMRKLEPEPLDDLLAIPGEPLNMKLSLMYFF